MTTITHRPHKVVYSVQQLAARELVANYSKTGEVDTLEVFLRMQENFRSLSVDNYAAG